MRLVEEADTAGAVCSLGWIKEKEEKRDKTAFQLSFVMYSPSCCKFLIPKWGEGNGEIQTWVSVIKRDRMECFYLYQKTLSGKQM